LEEKKQPKMNFQLIQGSHNCFFGFQFDF
jgi:hypothetical protein